MQNFHNSNSKYLLGLHNCSESFAVGIQDLENSKTNKKDQIFKIGRSLSNKIFNCIESLLPKEYWKQIIRIAVTTGPGSYTSTRLTLSIARTIAQQIGCSLDGISTFQLMASRLHPNLNLNQINDPFWIVDELPRRGIIAGQYQLIKSAEDSDFQEFNELIGPHLISNRKEINPSINASNDIEKDIIRLLEYSEFLYNSKIRNDWEKVLPIYPTSPVDKI